MDGPACSTMKPRLFMPCRWWGTTFRAGGEDGALFHSGDGGQHWKRVPLISGSATETGSIISIQFENSQQGTVLTAGGARWSTSDGAVSWILQ